MAKSMALNQAAGLGGMLKDGHKTYEGLYGAVFRNIDAAKAIAGMVQTSLGPNGMNKLVVNHLEKIILLSELPIGNQGLHLVKYLRKIPYVLLKVFLRFLRILIMCMALILPH